MSTANKAMPVGAALSPYDTAEFLRTPEEIAAYLEAVFEDYGDDPRVVVKALGDVARAKGMQNVSKATGLNREGLYKALSGTGNPSFDTVMKVMNAVGVELRPKAAPRKTTGKTTAMRFKSPKAIIKKVTTDRRFKRDPATGEFIAVGKKRTLRKQA